VPSAAPSGDFNEPDPAYVLTWRQRKVLQVIRDSVEQRGYSPSFREIGDAVGLASTSTVFHHLSRLEEKGYLRRVDGEPRTIEVRLPGHRPSRRERSRDENGPPSGGKDIASPEPAYVPLVGRITAGRPILAEQQVEEILPLPRQLVGQGTLFMLTVADDSMIDVGIAVGDWVVINQQEDAEDGEIVAALIDGKPAIRTLRRTAGPSWLIPHNGRDPDCHPILGDDASLLGRVVAMVRRV